MDVEIDRSRWLRGASETSELRNANSCHECCVGTIGRTAGIPARKLEGRKFIGSMDLGQVPRSLHEFLPAEPGLTRADDPRNDATTNKRRKKRGMQQLVCDLMYGINDDAALDDKTRERMLTSLAATIGIRLSFTGKPLPRHATPPSGEARAAQTAIAHGFKRPFGRLRVELATTIIGNNHEWEPLEKTTILLDTDDSATEAYVYDLLRAHAHEHPHAVRVTAREAESRRTVCDQYHEPA